jgi:hypothetical protein
MQQFFLTFYVRNNYPTIAICVHESLKRLKIDQVSQTKDITIDKNLIYALLERWREETNLFYMSMGEMTYSLQDMSCLWALPIKGTPVTGKSEE